jgi:hypothetical protein
LTQEEKAVSADYYSLREFVTENFYNHHVIEVKAHSAAALLQDASVKARKEVEEIAKKASEMAYQTRRREVRQGRRPVRVNTVLVIGMQEAVQLKAEVKRNQDAYRRREEAYQAALEAWKKGQSPGGKPGEPLYETCETYPFFERKGQRAEYGRPAYVRYGVDDDPAEHNRGLFKVYHLDPMSPTRGGRLHDVGSRLWVVV